MTHEHYILLTAKEKSIKTLSLEEMKGFSEYFWLMGERAMEYKRSSIKLRKSAEKKGIPLWFKDGYKNFMEGKFQ